MPHLRVCGNRAVCVFVYAQHGEGGGAVQDFGWGWNSARGWMPFFFFLFLLFHSIVKTTYFRQRRRANGIFSFFLLLEGSTYRLEEKRMELLISLTSPCCRRSARSGCDECLITRNTSQTAKSLHALNKQTVFSSAVLQTCSHRSPQHSHLFDTPIDFSTNFQKTMLSPHLFYRPVCFSSDWWKEWHILHGSRQKSKMNDN